MSVTSAARAGRGPARGLTLSERRLAALRPPAQHHLEPVDEPEPELTTAAVAERAGVSTATVRRWVAEGLVHQHDGRWTAAAAAQVRVIARLRARGHSLTEIRRAGESGLLATADLEEVLAPAEGSYTLAQAARACGLSPEVVERIRGAMGLSTLSLQEIAEEDLRMLRAAAEILDSGLPLPALIQMLRVYGQAIAQIADAEVRLFHMYVRQPLVHRGGDSVEVSEQMGGLFGEVLPRATPFMSYLHDRLLSHFVEQDLIGQMESDPGQEALSHGRLRVAIAFADLTGYTRLADSEGDEEALSAVEHFVEAVESSLPRDARIIKTLGDEVMIVGPNPSSLARWAVDFQFARPSWAPAPRIGVHHGEVLYRDGDYYGIEVNRAARVVARAAGGEVLVTRAVVDALSPQSGLRVRLIGEVRLKGFSQPTELFTALHQRTGAGR